MANPSGVSSEILSLPKGGGSIQNLSATFETDLNTGTGSCNIPIDLPAGPNGIKPQISIRYHSAAGNGPFGIGWTLGLMSLSRKIDGGIPTYAPEDNSFVLNGSEELSQTGFQTYRPIVDTMHWRILRNPPQIPEGWELTDTRGMRYELGHTASARIDLLEDGLTKTASWLLERIVDTNGNTINYSYFHDSMYIYLQRVEWGTYFLKFIYEDRPDKLSSGRYGFLQHNNQRCIRIELHVTTIKPTLVRSWTLEYQQAPGSGLSLLSGILINGHAEDGTTLSSPNITLGYTVPEKHFLRELKPQLPGALPGSFDEGRFELLDWDGNGLPDILEWRNGYIRIWPNQGHCKWGLPKTVAEVPAPLNFNQLDIAFADMQGNGTADLIVLSGPVHGYYPHHPLGGFGRPIQWHQVPASRFGSGNCRLMDLNGDGIVDMLTTGDQFYMLYYRKPSGDWAEEPQIIPRSSSPDVSFLDSHVKIADMNGDGMQDIVPITGSGLTYWPYLGNGKWSEAVEMIHPPRIPLNFDPRRLFTVDIDGDGCSDIVYVDVNKVTYWLNQGGTRIGDPVEISCTPPSRVDQIRIADVTGSGTIGVLWSSVHIGSRSGLYFYLDLMGNNKPYLLTRINSGIGLVTDIQYRSSTEYALDDKEVGHPWKTFHPFPLQCVSVIKIHDQTTDQLIVTRNTYHNGRYDGNSHTFLGFSQVDVENVGDDAIPTQVTKNTYHVGLDPTDLDRHLNNDEQLHIGALRRRLLRTEIYGLDGSEHQNFPYQIIIHEYDSILEPSLEGHIVIPFELRTVQENWERGTSPFSKREITYHPPDVHGNIPSQHMRVMRTGVEIPDQDIMTEITFSSNPSANIFSLPARIVQKDKDGNLFSATVTHYDGIPHVGLPEGQATIGNVTRVDKLAMTDEIAVSVYGISQQPDFMSLHYHRRTGENGWWITQNSYERKSINEKTELIVRNPRGFDTQIKYDSSRQYTVQLIDAAGSIYSAIPDLRTFQLSATTDPNDVTTRDRFDAFGRVTSTIAAGDSDETPTSIFNYNVQKLPISVLSSLRERSGDAKTIDDIQYINGRGQPVQQIVPGEGGPGRAFVVRSSKDYTIRGQVSNIYLPYYVNSNSYRPPSSDIRKIRLHYDTLGRLIDLIKIDGSSVTYTYSPGMKETVVSIDANDHSPRHMFHLVDGLDRVVAIKSTVDGHIVTATFEYDIMNRLIRTVNPDGGESRMIYDLLGRLLVTESPDSGHTVNIVDAAGNQVQRTSASGNTVLNIIDELDRLTEVKVSHVSPAEIVYTYLKKDDPLPPDGQRNRIGRLWKVQDRIGTLTTSYDERGNIVQTRRTVNILNNRDLVTDIEYDCLGRQTQIRLPASVPGAQRQIVEYNYNLRGLVHSSPGFVREAEYDVEGRTTNITFENMVEHHIDYNEITGRPLRERISGTGGISLREQTFKFDSYGNLSAIDSPNLLEESSFIYDDFDRLIKAEYSDGHLFQYAYSDGGNIVRIDTMEDLKYRPAGSGALVQADQDIYEYDADGRVNSAPYGKLHFDSLDNLRRVETPSGDTVDYDYDYNGIRSIKHVENGSTSIYADASIEFHDGKPLLWISFGNKRIVVLSEIGKVFLHSDSLGNPTLFTNMDGKEIRRIGFGPYGTLRFDSASNTDTRGVRFGGQVSDLETGLICMGHRYYDPRLGRFISPDILAAGVFTFDGWNRYIYAHNNPLRYTDPTGLLSWGDVLAIGAMVVVIAALVAASIVTMGAASVVVAGVSVSISGILATTAVGVAGGAILGGIAAAKAGGDIGAGILLGGFIGGVAGFTGGALGAWALSFPLLGNHLLASMAAGAIAGSIMGAGSGIAIGYAGGKGNSQQVWRHLLAGALAGALTGAVLGFVVGGIDPNSTLRIGNVDKLDPNRALNSTGIMEKIDFPDTYGSLGQDISKTAITGKWSAFTEFISTGHGSQAWCDILRAPGTALSIPIGWVPNIALNYGGIIGLNAISTGADKFGGIAFDDQILFLFNAFPFVGIALGFGFGQGGYGRDYNGNTNWYDTFQRFLHNNFSMQDK